MAAIFFMTSFNRDRGGMAPLAPPLDPQLGILQKLLPPYTFLNIAFVDIPTQGS